MKVDEEVFKNLGIFVKIDRRKSRFIPTTRDIASIYDERTEENVEDKLAIGTLSCSLIWGGNAFTTGGTANVQSPNDRIMEQLNDYIDDYKRVDRTRYFLPAKGLDAASRLKDRLLQYWKKRHRYCAIDAGTTTTQLAGCLADKRAPDKDARLASLTVVTNAPPVEQALQDPCNNIDILSLGGLLNKDTRARAGAHCEQAFDAWGIRVDIALVGTTSLVADEENGGTPEGCACDSADEARIKSRFLDRAAIRCIVMDSSKFKRYRLSAFIFAPLSADFVDVVVSDTKIFHEKPKDSTENEAWHKLWNAGIVVLFPASVNQKQQRR
ncbi:MAG: hypothetical protein HYZ00_05945 [Candidatus Hydrogenedentes bacterium]|nr:hypothetical protein [Candidatus Hydrogenedentota bacterium]